MSDRAAKLQDLREKAAAHEQSKPPVALENSLTMVVDEAALLLKPVRDLDAQWVSADAHTMRFLPYTAPPVLPPPSALIANPNAAAAIDAGIRLRVEALTLMLGDVQWLLQLNYSVFWSHAVYCLPLQRFIDLYLKFAPRSWVPLIRLVSWRNAWQQGFDQLSQSLSAALTDVGGDEFDATSGDFPPLQPAALPAPAPANDKGKGKGKGKGKAPANDKGKGKGKGKAAAAPSDDSQSDGEDGMSATRPPVVTAAAQPPTTHVVEVETEATRLLQLEKQLHHAVFLLLLRMGVPSESRQHFMSDAVHASIVYDNFIFDIPKMMDIASLYARSNHDLVQGLLAGLFARQPKYMSDLSTLVRPATLQSIATEVVWLSTACGGSSSLYDSGAPVPRAGSQVSSTQPKATPRDIIQHSCQLADAFDALESFVNVLPVSADLFMFPVSHVKGRKAVVEEVPIGETDFTSQGNLLLRSAFVADSLLPRLLSYWSIAARQVTTVPSTPDVEVPESAWASVEAGRSSLLRLSRSVLALVHAVLDAVYLVPLTVSSEAHADKPTSGGDWAPPAFSARLDSMFDNITIILSMQKVVFALEQRFYLTDRLRRLSRVNKFIDDTRIRFVCDGIAAISERKGATAARVPPPSTSTAGKRLGDVGPASKQHPGQPSPDLQQKVAAIRDIFPDLGVGFVAACLKHFDMSVERTTDALFDESSLPPQLRAHDRKDASYPTSSGSSNAAQVVPVHQAGRSLLDERLNVFDHDEFDLLKGASTTIDSSRIHVGRRAEPADARDLLDDKSFVREAKAAILESQYELEYDDEYDDTYDDNLDFGDLQADDREELPQQTGRSKASAAKSALDTSGVAVPSAQILARTAAANRDKSSGEVLVAAVAAASGPNALVYGKGGRVLSQQEMNQAKLAVQEKSADGSLLQPLNQRGLQIHRSTKGADGGSSDEESGEAVPQGAGPPAGGRGRGRGPPGTGPHGGGGPHHSQHGGREGGGPSDDRARANARQNKAKRANHDRKNQADRKRNQSFLSQPATQ
ncbi:hypothetical protein CAOG_06757 [Capsaspora owczarzaki ATCC 30864]|uniref:CUE domain-containing protein n=1 Tax=Capsaspora owczarzaki (strain ATCC 30864) TaxID=595528 RepID=A0A0D2VXN0_CAPO3|nr:hypothetical protein CAOG_06757 [Capsaspora owczarzaki ATCC 30864]KJE96427.1 hypothetical protein CAOG_006757 [Capsaspora owczarzaki ATCC 30864]|eukprot:XP_004344378.1 hypothetical protein CAOG_06757 [Capsaspora owczarzaki ATCC 30864]